MQDYPLFPINLFLLPGEYSQLYIFEERYKQLINEAWEGSWSFGLPFSNKLNARNYGTAVKVHEIVNRHENGEMEIIIRAVGNFRLDKFHYQKGEKLYPCGDVHFLDGEGNLHASAELMERFRLHMVESRNPDAELLALESPGIYELAALLNLSDVQKMDFISIESHQGKETFLLNYLRYLELLQEQESHVYKNLYLN
jgi:Lon protease-like protein